MTLKKQLVTQVSGNTQSTIIYDRIYGSFLYLYPFCCPYFQYHRKSHKVFEVDFI